MTTAEKFAELMDNDGQNFEDFEDALDSLGCIRSEWKGDRRTPPVRYTFADGSVVVEYDGCWDLGFSDCWCMRGAGHNDDCEAKK